MKKLLQILRTNAQLREENKRLKEDVRWLTDATIRWRTRWYDVREGKETCLVRRKDNGRNSNDHND